MKFQLDPALYDNVSRHREHEWRQMLTELNLDHATGEDDETTLTLRRRPDGGTDLIVRRGDDERTVPLSMQRLNPHFRDYRHIIEQLDRSVSGVGRRDLETLDYAKKLVHDEAAEMMQDALRGVVELEHGVARRLFTLVFLTSNVLPDSLMTRYRHR
ncbi:MAG: UPF0262 family protein [Myxococcota bacterium]